MLSSALQLLEGPNNSWTFLFETLGPEPQDHYIYIFIYYYAEAANSGQKLVIGSTRTKTVVEMKRHLSTESC